MTIIYGVIGLRDRGKQSDRSIEKITGKVRIGVGAIISYLRGSLSPEAQAAVIAYRGVQQSLENLIVRLIFR